MTVRKKIPAKKIVATWIKWNCHTGKTAAALKIDRTTLWRMRQEDPELSKAMADAAENQIDDVENTVRLVANGIPEFEEVEIMHRGKPKKVMVQSGWKEKPDMRAAKLLLEAKARDRGYGKKEIDISTSEPIQLMVTNRVVSRDSIKDKSSKDSGADVGA